MPIINTFSSGSIRGFSNAAPVAAPSTFVGFVAICSTPTGGLNNNIVATSPDGNNWTERPITYRGNTNTGWSAIGYGNNTYAIGAGGQNTAAYSSDTISWTASNFTDTEQRDIIAYGSNTFVATCSKGGSNIANTQYSTNNGANWTAATFPISTTWTDMAFGNGIFMAINRIATGNANRFATSTDGITWTIRTTLNLSNIGNSQLSSIAYGNSAWVVINGSSGTSSNIRSAISTDNGTNWTYGSSSTISGRWRSLAYGNGVWVAVGGYQASLQQYVARSTDGLTWANIALPSGGAAPWSSITYGNNTFVAVAGGSADTGASLYGNAAYSTDGGNTWSLAALPQTRRWRSITYGDGT